MAENAQAQQAGKPRNRWFKNWYDPLVCAATWFCSPGLALISMVPQLKGLRKVLQIASVVSVAVLLLSTTAGLPTGIMPALLTASRTGAVDLLQAAGEALRFNWHASGDQLSQFAGRQAEYLGRVAGWVSEGLPEALRNVGNFVNNVAKAFFGGVDMMSNCADAVRKNVPCNPPDLGSHWETPPEIPAPNPAPGVEMVSTQAMEQTAWTAAQAGTAPPPLTPYHLAAMQAAAGRV